MQYGENDEEIRAEIERRKAPIIEKSDREFSLLRWVANFLKKVDKAIDLEPKYKKALEILDSRWLTGYLQLMNEIRECNTNHLESALFQCLEHRQSGNPEECSHITAYRAYPGVACGCDSEIGTLRLG